MSQTALASLLPKRVATSSTRQYFSSRGYKQRANIKFFWRSPAFLWERGHGDGRFITRQLLLSLESDKYVLIMWDWSLMSHEGLHRKFHSLLSTLNGASFHLAAVTEVPPRALDGQHFSFVRCVSTLKWTGSKFKWDRHSRGMAVPALVQISLVSMALTHIWFLKSSQDWHPESDFKTIQNKLDDSFVVWAANSPMRSHLIEVVSNAFGQTCLSFKHNDGVWLSRKLLCMTKKSVHQISELHWRNLIGSTLWGETL